MTMNAITLSPSRLAMSPAIAKEYGISAPQWRVLTEQLFPSAKSQESILMALSYCKSRNLDVYKKPVHIVPMWSSEKRQMVETVWPGISEIRTTAARTGEYAGCDEIEYGPVIKKTFSGKVKDGSNWVDRSLTIEFPEWAKATVYRIVRGQKCSFKAKVRWLEAYARAGKSELPNSMWETRIYGQIDKCAEAAAIRMAFPEEVGSDYTADEMAGQVIIDHATETQAEVKRVTQMPPIVPDEIEPETGEIIEPDAENETPEEIFERAKEWFGNCHTKDDLLTAWEQFADIDLGDDDMLHLQSIYDEQEALINGKVITA